MGCGRTIKQRKARTTEASNMINITSITALHCLNSLYECRQKYNNLMHSETTEGMYEEKIISIDKAIMDLAKGYDEVQKKSKNLPTRKEIMSRYE